MNNKRRLLFICFILISIISQAMAQDKPSKETSTNKTKETSTNKKVMWEAVDVSSRNLLLGPGGEEWKPDLSNVTYVKDKEGGASEKFFIKDGAGKTWVVKIGLEAQPETAAVRLLWALGYKTEINYLVPTLTVPGKGTYQNARLEARPDSIERGDRWNWKENPFKGTPEFQGLKIMMAFLNNWDMKIELNNAVLQYKEGGEDHYVVSDLGRTFGKLGNNSMPIFWRKGRSTNNPKDYSESELVKETKENELKLAYKGQNSSIFQDITIEDGGWLANLLNQLTYQQISDAFRAANYSEQEVETLARSVQNRITEFNRATSGETTKN